MIDLGSIKAKYESCLQVVYKTRDGRDLDANGDIDALVAEVKRLTAEVQDDANAIGALNMELFMAKKCVEDFKTIDRPVYEKRIKFLERKMRDIRAALDYPEEPTED